ncbi:MAG TPA: hypothetical protein VF941_14455 [Clostridia bacterium]
MACKLSVTWDRKGNVLKEEIREEQNANIDYKYLGKLFGDKFKNEKLKEQSTDQIQFHKCVD